MSYTTYAKIDTSNITRAIKHCDCKTAVELYTELTNGTAKYRKWGERSFDEPDVLKLIITKYPWTWIDLCKHEHFMSKHPNRLSDYGVALLSCQKNSSMYQHLPDEFKVDDSIIEAALLCRSYREHNGEYRFGTNSNILKQIPAELNAKYAVLAVQQNGFALKHVLNKTDRVTLNAVNQEGSAFRYATERQKKTRTIRDTAFNQNMSLINNEEFLRYCTDEGEKTEKGKNQKEDDIKQEEQHRQHW